MNNRKAFNYLHAVMIFAIVVWQMALQIAAPVFADERATGGAAQTAGVAESSAIDVCGEPEKSSAVKPKDRDESLGAILSHVGIGKGSAVADIGAGDGRDTWVFAKIVGETGTVFSEEIAEGKVKSLESRAAKKGLNQVRAVLGRSDDPCLPPNSVDLAFMCHVYHHFAKPREMLRGIWRGLKPGGHLVIVDRHLGTLRDWVPRHLREEKHFWIAETTVVREAREEGFLFTACAEECWYENDRFVLIFQRPKELESPGCDPDSFSPISAKKFSGLFLPIAHPYQRPVFVALGEARELIAPILDASTGEGLDIVLEEWATQKEERPPLPPGVSLPSVLTDDGDPKLGDEQIDAVFFLDSYHLLFHGKTLLAKIYERLLPTGCVYVLDRKADRPLLRREASHRREIQVETVKQEMAEAGFCLWFSGPRPARDRLLLVFGKTPPEKVVPEDDPLVGGPSVSSRPGRWLKSNYWRLRGLKTADGRVIPLKPATRKKGAVETVTGASPGQEICRLTGEKLELRFEKKGGGYVLTDYRAME